MGETTEILRLSLAAILGVASVAKLWDLGGASKAMRSFGAPAALARPLAVALAVAEAVIAVSLLPASLARPAAIAATALFTVFAIVVAVARLRGRIPDCHCFGRLHSSPAGWPVVARNIALATAAAVVASQPASVISAIDLLVFGMAALVIGQALLVFTLIRRYGRALQRIEALEARPGQPATSPVPVAGTGAARPALAGGAAAAVAATTAVAQAAPPTDPELKAIDDALREAGPRIAAAAKRSAKAVGAQSTLRTGTGARAKRNAAREALAAERRQVLALRATIDKLPATGTPAHNVKLMVNQSLALAAQSLAKRRQAIAATPKAAQRLLEDAQKLLLQSLRTGNVAGKLLGRG